MHRRNDDILEAASVVEALEGTDGLLVLPATNRNVVALQIMLRRLFPDLTAAGCDSVDAQIITNLQGQPLLYLIDTRQWPEGAERKLLQAVPAVKAGKVPTNLRDGKAGK